MRVPHPNVTCVSLEGRGLLIEGAPGSGKSTLALMLIDRGAQLVGDDGVDLEKREGNLWAHPPASIRGLIEIRSVGIVELPVLAARLSLVLSLDPDAPRLPEVRQHTLHEAALPLIALRPGDPAQALRAEHALRIHGI